MANVKVLSARSVLTDALKKSNFELSGSDEKMGEYFQQGVNGNCGFIVEGDKTRFAEYFALAASGGCAGPVTEGAATGTCGFTIHGDHELAWVRKYFESAQSGNCGFTLAGA